MSDSSLDSVRIILVEPAGPLNVGSVARVMKNMGLCHLVLVNPRCDPFGPEARQMAVHATDVLETLRVTETLPDALIGCRKAVATTGKTRTLAPMLEHPRSALAWLVSDASEPDTAALIFGPEDRGLNNDELSQAQRFIYIPSNPAYPSLNLAQAVGICCYELHEWMANLGLQHQGADLLTQSGLALPEQPSGYFPRSAPLDQLEGFYQQLEQVLLTVGYLYPHTADSRMKKFRRLFGRAMPSSEEVAMLRGILSQVEWAVEHAKKP